MSSKREEMGNNRAKIVTFICLNCQNAISGIQDSEGRTKIKCQSCGTVTVSKIMSRRYIRLDIYAPQGQRILEE